MKYLQGKYNISDYNILKKMSCQDDNIKINCDICGGSFNKKNFSHHIKTVKHIKHRGIFENDLNKINYIKSVVNSLNLNDISNVKNIMSFLNK